MKIVQSNFLTLLAGVKQYQIPIYQRNYAWEKANCERLLSDIIKAGTPGSPNHYIGSVIVKEETRAGGVDIYNMIDGQQRMTTISLLLLALNSYILKYPNGNLPNTITQMLINLKDIYLTNTPFKGSSLYSKLYLKQGLDRTEFDNLLHGVLGSGLISKNYNYFFNEFVSNGYNPQIIFDGINNCQLAMVTLDYNENPQLLFEAVNDTGKNLKEVDKVRNWIFMGLPQADQDRLYRAYWNPMENLLKDRIDAFLRYYTMIVTCKLVGNEYYSEFKSCFILKVGTTTLIQNILSDILNYAKLYNEYLHHSFTPKKIDSQLIYISSTGKDNFTPVILKILKNFNNKVLNQSETIDMLKYIESYIVRRDMLSIPTNSLNGAMINMLKNCDSLADLKRSINILTNAQYMPTDAEMQTQLKIRNFYGLPSAYYYLERIEKSVNSAFSLNDPTIEHILPETMHTNSNPKPRVSNPNEYNWELDLGKNANYIHDTYQHTLGNLTILPRSENSKMGDYRFGFKKNWPNIGIGGFNYGYSHTPIRISQKLKNYDIWDDKAILDRCKDLVDQICIIWPHP